MTKGISAETLLGNIDSISRNPSMEIINGFKNRLAEGIADQYKTFKSAKNINEINEVIKNIRKIRVYLGIIKIELEKKTVYKKMIEGKKIQKNDEDYIKGMQDIIDDFVRDAHERLKKIKFHPNEVGLIKEELSEIAYDKSLVEELVS